MTENTKNAVDLTTLCATGDALLNQAILLRAQISATSFLSASPKASRDFIIGRHWTFSPDQEELSQPPIPLKPYAALLPGLVFGYESKQPVLAERKWMQYGESTENAVPAYLLRVRDPAATHWLTIEILLDALAVKELGLTAVSLTACCIPALKISSRLRVYCLDDTYQEIPCITKVLNENKTTLVDGFVIPAEIRDKMCTSKPVRYIFYFPIMAFDFILFEGAAYPSIREV